MKKCNVCGERFADKFSFCPVDGSPFRAGIAAFTNHDFNLTIIDEARLAQRLAIQLEFVLGQLKRAWPSFRNHPFAFTRHQLLELKQRSKQTFARPHVLTGSMTAVVVVTALILSVLFVGRHAPKATNQTAADELSEMVTIDFQNQPKTSTDSGDGAGEKGRVGFESDKGEGSRPVPARAQGGGSGGKDNPLPVSQGRLPQPSIIPAPISTTYARLPPQVLPAADLDIDPVLWKKLEFTSYGDPRSKSTVASNGPGNGGGVGTNDGTGIGDGSGPGFGRGRDGNMGDGPKDIGGRGKGGSPGDNPSDRDIDRVYNPPEVTQRARVIFKPEPQYTEEARKADTTGTVILRVVFSRTGEVTNIRAIKTLPFGLTEKAIAAARLIRFVPATRNGQPVSMYMQLEYNFNLY